MAMTVHVDIVSAEEEIYSGTAEMIIARAEQGDVGIKPRHSPLLTQLRPGQIRLLKDDTEEVYYVSGGILEVQPHVVTILADTALRARDIDEAKAEEAKQRAEQALKDQKAELDYAAAQAELAEAVAQLRTLRKYRDTGSRQ